MLSLLPFDTGPRTLLTDGGIDFGSVECGEGIWPSFSINEMEEMLAKNTGSNNKTLIARIKKMPTVDALLDCRIVSFHLAMGSQIHFRLGIAQWLLVKKEIDFNQVKELFIQIEGVVEELGKILKLIRKVEGLDPLKDYRLVVSSLIKRLELLRVDLKNQEFHPWFEKQVKMFIVDTRRILYFFVQNFHVPYSFVLEGEDREEGALTSLGDERQGLSALVQIGDLLS